jgi:hypothetical protein
LRSMNRSTTKGCSSSWIEKALNRPYQMWPLER